MAFPATLTAAVDAVTEIVSAHLNNVETKIGIDSSAVVTSLDYLLKHASSVEPGHKHFQLWTPSGGAKAIEIDANSNILLGAAAAAGTSAVKVTVTPSGTAPTTSPADAAQEWAQDQAAGNSCKHFRTENGEIIKLYQQAHIVDADEAAGEAPTKAEYDALVGKFNALLVYLENLGFNATA